MAIRQHCTPILYEDGHVQKLVQFPLEKPPFREDTLQKLLADHPSLLPLQEIEAAFSPAICLGREIPTKSGRLDLLYVTPDGYPTLVETKLWDNPESRRAVVGQIIEYAKDLSTWSYEELDKAVQKSIRPDTLGNIFETVKRQEPEVEESVFVDNLSKNLRMGRFLLLIAGNGIREQVEHMTSFLQKTPSMYFTLALVEFALFRFQENQKGAVLIQPRVVARTAEVERAIVKIEAPPSVKVKVTLPSDSEKPSAARRVLTEEVFYEELAENTNADICSKVRKLVDEFMNFGLIKRWRSKSLSLRLPDPGESNREFTVVVFTTSGTFFVGWLDYSHKSCGYSKNIGLDFLEQVMLLTGAKKMRNEASTVPQDVRVVLKYQEKFLENAKQMVDSLKDEAKKKLLE